MKWKFFVTLASVLVLSALLCLPSFAATLPNGVASSTDTITSTELFDASRDVWLNSWNPVEERYYSSKVDVIWDKVSRLPNGQNFSGVGFTIDGFNYQYRNLTNIYTIDKLSAINNVGEFDWYFGFSIKIFYPASNYRMLFEKCTVYPVYADSSGNVKGDTSHVFSLPVYDISSVTVNNSPYFLVTYRFDYEDKYIGVPYHWIPDNYSLSGFGFIFDIAHGTDTTTNVDDWYIPSGTKIFFSEISFSSYMSSNATTLAIENMTERMEEALAEQTEEITDEIKEQTEELTNGWESNPVTPDGAGDINNYEDAEKQLLNSQQAALDQSTGILNGVGASLDKFSNGFAFIGNIFNLMIGVEWISILLTVSLALGIVAFLLNITPSLVRRFASRDDKGEGG